ncbi:uncharacterized protein LOC122856226 [Aphidius gifuensis]|uniref:uncharacterized protein LOC122856226 n=1 Tax=Aphidius gifuensis TaxID=684658 RepID=UPI001CDD0921|nr:uncharacterized protein LOC122856226 [Aphidius gifuensis]
MKGIKIKKADKPTSVICLTCIEQCISFFKNQQVNNNVSNMAVANLSTSHQPKLETESSNNSVGSSADKSINILDYDCLAKVLMLFPPVQRIKLENVCTKWKKAGSLAWYDIKEINFNALQIQHMLNKELILKKILFRCGCYLTHLSFEIFNTEHSELFDVIENNCRNVTHLSLDMMIHPLGYFNWIKSLKKLQCLKVNGGVPEGLYEKILAMIPKDIKEIYLLINKNSEMEKLRHTAVKALLEFHNLSHLALHNVFIGKDLMEALSLKTKLVYLDLKGCHFWENDTSMFSKLINLEHLDLRYVEHLDDYVFSDIVENYLNTKSVVALVNNCRNLKTLKILLSNNVSANAFKKIRNLKKLEHLHASSRATVASPVELGNLIKLETLILNNFNEVPPEIFKKLDRLKHLDFSLCKNVTDSVAAYVIDNCQNLTYLCCSETGISIDFLNYTVEKFKYRTNNNILIIHVDESLYEDFDEKENYSSGLRVMQDYL